MPRIARKYSQSNFHHTMVQGINKEFIFKDDKHINSYKNIILNKLESSNVTILCYCIMNNHSHFLIYSEKNEFLSNFMQKINTSYSRFYNITNKRVGYVFRDRYLSQDILNHQHLYNCLKYIHNNPVKANMVKNMADYKYSSYNEFLGEKCIISDKSLRLLFGTTKNYMNQFKFIHSTFNEENFIDIKDKSISEFTLEFENKINAKVTDIIKDKPLLTTFINEARKQTDVKIEELAQILDISKSTVGNYIKKN